MHADAWAAWAQWATAAIAFGAAVFAYQQVKESRQTRERVAQPNVVVFVDHNPTNWHFFDLVIKNFGETPAYDVRVTVPDLRISPFLFVEFDRLNPGALSLHGERLPENIFKLQLPKAIAVLAPGQEWRTLWDSIEYRDMNAESAKANPRAKLKELGSTYVGHVAFRSTDKTLYTNPVLLETDLYRNTWRMLRAFPD